MNTVAMTRGITSASTGPTPMVRIASISSVIFMVPICAAKAEPERPATMIAVMSMPSSRRVRRPTRLTVNTSAPKSRNWLAPCWAMTMPMRKLINPTIPSARMPTMSKCWITEWMRKRRGWTTKLPTAFIPCPKKARKSRVVAKPEATPAPTSFKNQANDV